MRGDNNNSLAPSSAAETRLQRLQRQRQRRNNNNTNNARQSSSSSSAANGATGSAREGTNAHTQKLKSPSKASRNVSVAPLSPPPSSPLFTPPPPPPITTSPKSRAVSVSIAESRRHYCRSPSALPIGAVSIISPSPPPAFPKLLNETISLPDINNNNHSVVMEGKNDHQIISSRKHLSRDYKNSFSSPSKSSRKIEKLTTMEQQQILPNYYRNGEYDDTIESSNARKKLTSQSSFLSQASMPSDEGTPNHNSKNNIAFCMDTHNSASNGGSSSGGGGDDTSSKSVRNMWKDMPRRTTHNSHPQNINSSYKNKTSSAELFPSSKTSNVTRSTISTTWSERSTESPSTTSSKKDSYSPSRVLVTTPSNGGTAYANNNNISKPISVRQQVNLKFTRKQNISSPVSVMKHSPNQRNYHHQYHGHGGTPVWIHSSLLLNNDVVNRTVDGDAWEWVRGYLLPTNEESNDSITVTVDDPDTKLSNLNGHSFIIPKRYIDGSHIVMGNTWWSASEISSGVSPSSSALSPSPTSITQSLDGSHPNTATAVSVTTNSPKHTSASMMPPQDLAELTHLHEPAVVHALRIRYRNDMIYTYTGNILLALNPFKMLNHLYTHEMMELFWGESGSDDDYGGGDDIIEEGESSFAAEKGHEGRRDSPPPHAYAVAERAYSSMLHCLKNQDGNMNIMLGDSSEQSLRNQTILVSGESGAGKTVTTKIIMRYLSILSQRHSNGINHHRHGRPGVEMQVLQSNPVLESFGNARTIRNDNSSRFGKFIEMSFQARKNTQSLLGKHCGSLLGATIDVYLLEKVRLVSVNPGERNYHIFYELLSPRGMNVKEKQRYKLTSHFGKGKAPLTVKDFSMTSMSGTFDRRDGVDDSDTYQELRTAMNTVGFSLEEQDGIFAVVAALLHASNLQFVNDGGDKCDVSDRDGASDVVANLLGVSEESLKLALTTSIIEARGELLVKNLSTSQADKALEATVKAIYGALFAYIVSRINKSIEVQGDFRNTSGGNLSISVLDIFGFLVI